MTVHFFPKRIMSISEAEKVIMLVNTEKKSKMKPVVSLNGRLLKKSDDSRGEVRIDRNITMDDKDKDSEATSVTVKT